MFSLKNMLLIFFIQSMLLFSVNADDNNLKVSSYDVTGMFSLIGGGLGVDYEYNQNIHFGATINGMHLTFQRSDTKDDIEHTFFAEQIYLRYHPFKTDKKSSWKDGLYLQGGLFYRSWTIITTIEDSNYDGVVVNEEWIEAKMTFTPIAPSLAIGYKKEFKSGLTYSFGVDLILGAKGDIEFTHGDLVTEADLIREEDTMREDPASKGLVPNPFFSIGYKF
jgi:hypothetical protein